MCLTIAYSKIKKQNLVLINNGTYQRETLSERPIRQPLNLKVCSSQWYKKPHFTQNVTCSLFCGSQHKCRSDTITVLRATRRLFFSLGSQNSFCISVVETSGFWLSKEIIQVETWQKIVPESAVDTRASKIWTCLFLANHQYIPDPSSRLAHQQIPLLSMRAIVLMMIYGLGRFLWRIQRVHMPCGHAIEVWGLTVHTGSAGADFIG